MTAAGLLRPELTPRSDDKPDGGHHLVVSLGDCVLIAACVCGHGFGTVRIDRSLDAVTLRWESHVMDQP